MPIDIQDTDGGFGNIIVSRGTLTDQDLIGSLKTHLLQDREKFRKYKYTLIDNTAIAKTDITNETVELITGLIADTSRANPDIIAAVVVYVTIAADIESIKNISRIFELFTHQPCWETMVFRTRIEAVRWIREKAWDKFGIDDLEFG